MPDFFNPDQEPLEENTLGDFSIFEGSSETAGVAFESAPGSMPIREKTFNKELKDLVAKVTSHDEHDDGDVRSDFMTDESAIRRLHSLFYRAIGLRDLEGVNPALEPPALLPERPAELSVELIHDEMKSLSMPNFAILTYHLEKRCYVPTINNIGDLDVSNMFLDIDDELYVRILAVESGIFLTSEEINGDFFLKKRFPSLNGSTDEKYYLNSFRNLYAALLSRFKDPQAAADTGLLLSPILLIRLAAEFPQSGPDEISEKITRKLSHHLFSFAHQEFNKLQIFDHGRQGRLFGILEFLFNSYSIAEKRRCCVVRSTAYLGRPHIYLVSYAFSKIQDIISSPSCAFRIDKDRMVIFANQDEGILIDELVSGLNGLYDNAFSLSVYDNRQRISFNDFMMNHIL